MKQAIAWSAVALLLSGPALAGDRKAKPRANPVDAMARDHLPDDFDLARAGALSIERASTGKPALPKGMDTRDFAWDPPAFEVALNRSGAVLAVGAMGTRHKGMPKLAHVGIDWDF